MLDPVETTPGNFESPLSILKLLPPLLKNGHVRSTWGSKTKPFVRKMDPLFLIRTAFSLQKHIEYFLSTLRRSSLKTQLSPVILDLCLKKTQAGKSRDYYDFIVFEKFRFQNVFPSHENENRRSQISPAYSMDPTSFPGSFPWERG